MRLEPIKITVEVDLGEWNAGDSEPGAQARMTPTFADRLDEDVDTMRVRKLVRCARRWRGIVSDDRDAMVDEAKALLIAIDGFDDVLDEYLI